MRTGAFATAFAGRAGVFAATSRFDATGFFAAGRVATGRFAGFAADFVFADRAGAALAVRLATGFAFPLETGAAFFGAGRFALATTFAGALAFGLDFVAGAARFAADLAGAGFDVFGFGAGFAADFRDGAALPAAFGVVFFTADLPAEAFAMGRAGFVDFAGVLRAAFFGAAGFDFPLADVPLAVFVLEFLIESLGGRIWSEL